MGSFAIYVFIGDFPANPALWAQEPHLVYSAGVLTGGAAEAANHPNGAADDCENCRRQRESRQRYRDFVPLTKMLVDYQRSGEVQPPAPATDGMSLRSLDPDDVVPFLKRNLHWRVIGVRVSITFIAYICADTCTFSPMVRCLESKQRACMSALARL